MSIFSWLISYLIVSCSGCAGLFRRPPPPLARKTIGSKRPRRLPPKAGTPLELGSLSDLRAANKGGMDPDGEEYERACLCVGQRFGIPSHVLILRFQIIDEISLPNTWTGFGTSVVAADILWSDPVADPGLQTNDTRGVGLIFGPDVTQVCGWREEDDVVARDS